MRAYTEAEKENLRLVAIVLSTFEEIERTTPESLVMGGLPNGPFMVKMQMVTQSLDFDEYVTLIHVLKRAGYMTESYNVLSLTEEGRRVGAKINAHFAAAEAARAQ